MGGFAASSYTWILVRVPVIGFARHNSGDSRTSLHGSILRGTDRGGVSVCIARARGGVGGFELLRTGGSSTSGVYERAKFWVQKGLEVLHGLNEWWIPGVCCESACTPKWRGRDMGRVPQGLRFLARAQRNRGNRYLRRGGGLDTAHCRGSCWRVRIWGRMGPGVERVGSFPRGSRARDEGRGRLACIGAPSLHNLALHSPDFRAESLRGAGFGDRFGARCPHCMHHGHLAVFVADLLSVTAAHVVEQGEATVHLFDQCQDAAHQSLAEQSGTSGTAQQPAQKRRIDASLSEGVCCFSCVHWLHPSAWVVWSPRFSALRLPSLPLSSIDAIIY